MEVTTIREEWKRKLLKFTSINPLRTNAPNHIETSQLICIANQSTDFYMMENIRREWFKRLKWWGGR